VALVFFFLVFYHSCIDIYFSHSIRLFFTHFFCVCVPLRTVVVQDAIAAAGGLRVVVEAMRQHPLDKGVQGQATYALLQLVEDHAANQVRGRFHWGRTHRE
jgi:hypothetical protein